MMSFNLIAILISLAMMLTGAGGEGQSVEASRTLTLSNVSITYNGETAQLGPAARLGAYTDGARALFDFGVELKGETLLPIQLGADEAGVTALFAGSDSAVRLSAKALEGLAGSLPVQQADAGSVELMQFMTEKLMPAYAGLMSAVQDSQFQAELQAKGNALFDERIDRGEGTPDTELIEGESVEVTRYTYTLDEAQLAGLADALTASCEPLKNYADAVFELYAMLPEETGLKGIGSYAELFEKSGVKMTMEMNERRNADGTVVVTDAVLTMDMSGAIQAAAQGQGADAPAAMPPIAMQIHASEVNGSRQSSVSCDYEFAGSGMSLTASGLQQEESVNLEMSMTVAENGVEKGDMKLTASGDASAYNMLFSFDAEGSATEVSVSGSRDDKGLGRASVSLAGQSAGNVFAVSFDLDVTDAPFEDVVTGREADLVIDDLSEEGMAALNESGEFATLMMKAGGSLALDAQKLMADEGVQKLVGLFQAIPQAVVTGDVVDVQPEAAADGDSIETEVKDAEDDGNVEIEIEDAGDEPEAAADDGNFEIEIEGDENDGDFEYLFDDFGDDGAFEEVEDDGVLGFEVPQLTWLPEGWTVAQTNQDTAYDWVDMSVTDQAGADSLYVIFFADPEGSQVSYLVSDSGKVSPVEGREINVSDYGEGSMSVSLRHEGLFVNMMFASDAIDVETIGKIVAGIEFGK